MHDHSQDHTFTSRPVRRKLYISTAVTFVFVIFELGAGLHSNSLGLIGDAFHNFTDGIALLLALVAVLVERRPPTRSKSFGYQRAGILTAFVNAAMLLALTAVVFFEAWQRFRNPEPVNSSWMLGTAVAALAVNSTIAWWLHAEGRRDVNIRSAFIHQLGDALASAGVIVAAILIATTGSTIFDPLISVLIGALILWSSWAILRETVNLLLEGTPRGIDPDAVATALAAHEGVFGVHHLHIWALGPSRSALSCHLLLGDVSLRSANEVLGAVNDMLESRFEIVHTTIQLEHACEDASEGCEGIETGNGER